MQKMSEESKSASISGSLALDGSGEGLSISGNADNAIAAKGDLKAEDDIVGATINLSNLDESDVRNILETLKPYEHNMKVLTKKDLSAGVGLDSFGLGLKNSTERLFKSDLSLDSSADLPAVSFNGLSGGLNAEHGVDGKITGPRLNADLPKLSLNKPSVDAGAAVTMPSIGLPGSDVDGSLKTPDVSVSAPKVKIPNASLKVDKPDLKSGEYQAPKFKLPTVEPSKAEMDVSGDLDLPSVRGKVDAPNLNLSTPKSSFSGGLNAEHGVDGKITGPTLNADLPKLSLNKPSVDAGAAVTMPSIGLPGSEIDSSLKTPDVSVSAPKVKIPNASLKVNKSGEYQAPKFKMPNFKLPKIEPPKAEMDVSGDLDLPSVSGKVDAPNLNLSTPKSHFNMPNVEINEPKVNLNDPDLKFEAPNADIEAPSGIFKWPHLKWKSPNVKGPDTDLNAEISVPDASVPMAKVDGDLDVDIDFPKGDIKGPEVDIDSPSGKINWPHLKWKKPKFHGSKDGLDIDANIDPADVNLSLQKVKGDLDPPDVDIKLPKADIKGTDLDLQTPDLDVESSSGKINWPHLKWKKPKVHGLAVDGDLNGLDANLESPKIEGDINVPKAELNLAKADLTAPDVDDPSGKINWPHLKWKKPKVHGPKAEVDGDWNTPDLDLSAPKIDGKITSPDVDLNLPKADVDIKKPELDIDPPSGKFKVPTLKKPKWALSQPKVKGPDVDLDAELSGPDLEVSAPKIDGKINSPDVDLNLPKADVDIKKPELDIDPPSGKIKVPTLKKPKWALSQPKVKGPDVDLDANLSSPDLELSAPKIDGKINSPDVDLNLPKADVDIKKPELDINRPSGKFKVPTLKKPKWALSQPKVKGPDVDLDAELSGPDLELSAPKIDGKINSPDIDLNLPKADVDIKKPELDIDPPSGKIKWPTLKKPKWALSQPKVNGPDVDLDANLSSPDLELSAPKIDGKINSPDVDLNLPKADVDIKKPELDINRPSGKFKVPTLKKPKWALSQPKVKGPDVDLDAELSGPDLELSAPTIDGKINSPDIDLNLPKADVDIKKPELDIDPPSGKIKWPTLKKPKWALSQPKVNGPDVDLDANLSSPDLELSAPKIDGKINSPDVDLNLPKADVDIKKPELDINRPSGKFKVPTLKKPKWALSQPKVNGPDVDLDADLSGPDLHLSAPKIEAEIHTPDLNLEAPKTQLQGQKLDLNAKLPNTELEAPDVTLKSPNLDTNAPKLALTAPDGQIKTPGVELDPVLGDFKLPHFKVPALDLSSPNAGIEAPKVNLSDPDADASISVPAVELNGPKVEGPKVDISAPDVDANEKSRFPHFKIPKFSFSGSKPKTGEVNDSADDDDEAASNIETDVPVFRFHSLPKSTFDGPSNFSDAFGLSKRDDEEQDYVVRKGIRLPVSNAAAAATSKIDIMQILKLSKEKLASFSPTEDANLRLAAPSLDVGASAEGSTLGTLKIEKPGSVEGPADEDQRLSQSLANMLCLDSDDPVAV